MVEVEFLKSVKGYAYFAGDIGKMKKADFEKYSKSGHVRKATKKAS